MQTFFRDVLVQMKGIWSRLDGGQRLIVAAVLLATMVGLGGIVWFAGQPSYETVITAKTNDEIVQIKQALGQAGVSYRVDDSGRAFSVERSKVGLANMELASAGLRGGSVPTVGGGTSFIEDAETRAWKLDAASRAQAAAAIAVLDGVIAVNVTASRPRRTAAFRDRDGETRASASVVLRIKPGFPFEPLARNAAFVAASQLMVPIKNIDVVSAVGSQHWRYDPDREAGGGSSEFLGMQRGLSEERTRMAQERLDQMWPGKTSVSVNLELDATWEITSQKVIPEESIVKSEMKDSTVTSAAKTADSEGKGGNSSTTEKSDRQFVTEIGERRSGKMAPDTKRMTVALLYDPSLEQTTGFNKDDLVNAVKAIVGWDPARDKPESFSTLAAAFVPVDPATMLTAGPGMADVLLQWGPTVGQILGVFVVVLFLRGLFKRAGSSARADAGVAIEAEVKDENLPPEEQQKRMRREIERSIASDPAALAKMLESWLTEQKA